MKIEKQNITINLFDGEGIIHEGDTFILTNQRLMVSSKPGRNSNVWGEAQLEECLDPKLKNAGKSPRKWLGYRLLAIGFAMVGLQMIPYLFFGANILGKFPSLIESFYFLASMLTTTAGTYLTLGSYLNRPPHTSILFGVPGSKDLLAVLPGWDSEEADELVSKYRRAKRNM
ncbi:MAG: hypothetical protein DK303_000476 [Chloroflexi bacterium]|jgi:hypothetical protein|nr:MAG: hypothetical protein DK303_000476 [Chloroflexota bacterium]